VLAAHRHVPVGADDEEARVAQLGREELDQEE
jgi:hypothetical protein